MQALLAEATQALGAERAIFVSFVHDDLEFSACRFTLACDPSWCQQYLANGGPQHDAWLAYAARNSEPVVASFSSVDPRQQRLIDLATAHGFESALLAPAHDVASPSRVSVLILGSSRVGHFDDAGFGLLRIGARMLACQLHDWWGAHIRQELVAVARLTADELALLRFEQEGRSSKAIADVLDVSKSSIDSRFQRLNIKLGVPNRRHAARLAAACGLLSA